MRPAPRWLLPVLLAALQRTASAAPAKARLEALRLPPGFSIGVFAEGLAGARSMALGPGGTLFVGTRAEGRVYAVPGASKTGRASRVIVVARGLREPNGVAVRDGALFVAERSRILRFDDIEGRLDSPPEPAVVRDDYPKEAAHGWKFIAFGPDGWLYVPVGAPCNACKPKDPLFATITRITPDGSRREVYARGVRNTVGFDWDPRSRALWFTDNGRDWLGDDEPPDELDEAPRPGMDFGFPYCYGRDIPDPRFGPEKPCRDFTPPALELPAHVAALGMRFYDGGMFPPEYRGDVFVAEHGSWNRTIPVGYRVTRVRMRGGKPVSYEPFAQGWLPPQPTRSSVAWGRPVDVLVMPDGALLVSDDKAGAVYRISYSAPSSGR